MTLEQKRDIIAKNKEPIIAALNSVLDTLYNITDSVVDDEGKIKENLFNNKKAKSTAVSLRADIEKYEPIREKLLNNDFNLSANEIAYIGISLFFCSERAKAQIASIIKAKELCDSLINELSAPLDNVVPPENGEELFKKALDSLKSQNSES